MGTKNSILILYITCSLNNWCWSVCFCPPFIYLTLHYWLTFLQFQVPIRETWGRLSKLWMTWNLARSPDLMETLYHQTHRLQPHDSHCFTSSITLCSTTCMCSYSLWMQVKVQNKNYIIKKFKKKKRKEKEESANNKLQVRINIGHITKMPDNRRVVRL